MRHSASMSWKWCASKQYHDISLSDGTFNQNPIDLGSKDYSHSSSITLDVNDGLQAYVVRLLHKSYLLEIGFTTLNDVLPTGDTMGKQSLEYVM